MMKWLTPLLLPKPCHGKILIVTEIGPSPQMARALVGQLGAGQSGAYSVFKFFTGLRRAVRNAWILTVARVIARTRRPASTKTHQLIVVRY